MNFVFDNESALNGIDNDSRGHNEITLRDSLNTLLSNYSIILFCSFLDEYDKYFAPRYDDAKLNERIILVKQRDNPGRKRIRRWTDLKAFRNQLAAHNFRINGKSFFEEDVKDLKFKIPNTNSEKNLFAGIVHLICLNIRDEFPRVVEQINPNEIMLDKMKIISETVDTEKELTSLHELMS